jgi:peptide/nickel transport system permease protein
MTEGPGALYDLALPGLRDLLGGRRRRGALVLGGWLFLWGVAVVQADRIAATLRGGRPDEWIALASLVAGMAACWWAAGGSAAEDAGRGGEEARRPAGKGVGRAGPSATGSSGPAVTHAGPEEAGVRAAGRPAGARPDLLRRFLRHRQATLGLVLLAALAAAALLTPYLAPHDPQVGDRIVETRYQSPSVEHPMGTDRFGRDVFSRVLYGARISLGIGVTAVLIAMSLGTLVGAVAGYVGGWTDSVAMRLVDMLLSFPRLVLLITLVALFEPSVALVTMVLGATGWMGTSRIVRGEVLSIREEEYVEAARALGFGDARILLRHVLPNALTPVIVSATLGVGNTILAEAALSFLGLGVQPPAASWGTMVAAGRDVMLEAWWITLFPGLAIVFTVMSFNLVGDGLRDALDPRHAPGT